MDERPRSKVVPVSGLRYYQYSQEKISLITLLSDHVCLDESRKTTENSGQDNIYSGRLLWRTSANCLKQTVVLLSA